MEQGSEGGRPGYLHLLWPRVTESGVRLVRIGGNGYEHGFPDEKRLVAMIAAVRAAGAEPLLQVPSRLGAAEAEALVRRLNASPATRVRFWSIGNEPLLRKPDIIREVHAYLMRIAPAMKKADPTIAIFVFDECEMRAPAFEALCGGTLDITGRNPDGTWIVDGFTFHRYPFGKEFTRDDVVVRGAADIRKGAIELVAMMARADQKHGRTGDARLKWGLTEVNVTWANPDRRVEGFGNPSFLGGQFLAEVFGVGMELGAFTVAPWCISETDHAETDFGYLGLPPEFHPRSSYYHMQLMARHMSGSFVPSRTSEPSVKSIATRDGDGLAVMLLNELQDRDLEYDLALSKDATSTRPLVVQVDAGLAVTRGRPAAPRDDHAPDVRSRGPAAAAVHLRPAAQRREPGARGPGAVAERGPPEGPGAGAGRRGHACRGAPPPVPTSFRRATPARRSATAATRRRRSGSPVGCSASSTTWAAPVSPTPTPTAATRAAAPSIPSTAPT